MKATNIFYFLLVLFSLAGCQSEENAIQSITLSVNKESIDIGDSVIFTVKAGNGDDLSNKVKYFVNGKEITGRNFTPDEVGTYSVKATYENLTSNVVHLVVENITITLTISNDKIDIGESVVFNVTASNGQNLSSKAKYFVNDTEVSGMYFTPNAVGTYSVKATYQDLISNVVNLEVEEPGPRFQKRPVVEDYTGTWCGWCPRVAHAIELLEDATDFAIPIGIHSGDSMETTYVSELASAFNVTGYPTAYIDRDVEWAYPEPENVAQVTNLVDEDALAGLSVESSVSGTTINLKVKAQFGKDFDDVVKLVVVILEDGIKEDQANYTSYYGGVDTLVDFEHDHVLRHAITPVLGDAIPESETKKNKIYTKEYTLSVPSVIDENDKMSFVAMLVNSSKKVINAQIVKVNETADFELK